jgi:hypothetical protein
VRGRTPKLPARAHDRTKPRLLDPADPVLHVIGITDHQGRIKPTRQAKYRQVEEFLRLLDGAVAAALEAQALPEPTPDRPLRVVDLGCGNAYLTFAAFAYLTGARGLAVQMVGIDVRPQSVQRNTELAAELGWSNQLRFEPGTIAGAVVDPRLTLCSPCTPATPRLTRRWRGPCSGPHRGPCCTVLPPRPAGPAAREAYSLRRSGWSPGTGSLGAARRRAHRCRCEPAILRQRGYRVEVLQFVEDADTPRNVLLRAVRTQAPPSPDVQREYDELVSTWQVRPSAAADARRG